MRRRRLLAALLIFLLALGITTYLVMEDTPEPRRVTLPMAPAGIPEGGSGLGSEVRAAERSPVPERSLLGALAAVLERSAPERTDPSRPASTAPVRSARDLAARLPRSRAAAQVLLTGFAGTVPRAPFFRRLARLDVGGVIIEQRNFVDPAQLTALTGEIGVVAKAARHLPPLVGVVPFEGFESAAAAGLTDPVAVRDSEDPAVETRAAPTPAGVGKAARGVGRRLRAAGIGFVLGPVVDLAPDAPYGDDPVTTRALASAALGGLRESGVLGALTHFPGQGAATQDPLLGPAGVGLPRKLLLEREAAPFRQPVRAVVVSNAQFAAFDGVTPAAQDPAIARDLLRGEFGFRGVAIADDLLGAAGATGRTVGEAAVAALRAGCDMVYVRDDEEREEAYRAVLAAVRRGALPGARLREAVARVLELKAAAKVL
jgi:beta-N-acetylhexosaminidase